jgi:hypothetical protein
MMSFWMEVISERSQRTIIVGNQFQACISTSLGSGQIIFWIRQLFPGLVSFVVLFANNHNVVEIGIRARLTHVFRDNPGYFGDWSPIQYTVRITRADCPLGKASLDPISE